MIWKHEGDILFKQLKKWLDGVQFLPASNQIPAWVEEGIDHGFEGIGFHPPSTYWSLDQVHGIDLVEARATMNSSLPRAGDGLWTQELNGAIAVKTADCVPVLIYHPHLVMALHAGWKGLAQDIFAPALQVLKDKNLDISDCKVGIGPAIGLDSFEVGPEVLSQFLSGPIALDEMALALATNKGVLDRWHLDLGLLAALRLQKVGCRPEQISIVRSCSQKHPMLWHSYRRDGARAGRNWSWISKR